MTKKNTTAIVIAIAFTIAIGSLQVYATVSETAETMANAFTAPFTDTINLK